MAPSADDPGAPKLSRRSALGLGGAVLGASVVFELPGQAVNASVARSVSDVLRPAIHPRSDWATDHPVVGELVPEDDVRFLLVHHTASDNEYQPDEVPGIIRGFYGFHTSAEKEWPDVAYNFLIDRFGGIWEARAGSIDGPIRGDATGGSQGFALLCSLIGNHGEAPVSDEAKAGLVQLLTWLGHRHGLDTTAGASTTFTSRGSNRWPAGTEVTTATISGHRDMSQTTCPGDFAYNLLADDIPNQVQVALAAAEAEVEVEGKVEPPPEQPAVTVAPTPPAETAAPTTLTGAVTSEPQLAIDADNPSGDGRPGLIIGAAATAVAVVVAAAVRLRHRVSG